MDVAGLVLGALPLLISAAENYELTFEPFITFHQHVNEMKRFRYKLETQRTIFKNQCQILLSLVDGNLTEILQNAEHPHRTDPLVGKRLEELLGASCGSCVSTLTLIKEGLEKVTKETAGFKTVVEEEKENGTTSFSKFRLKLKISFAKTRLNDIVKDLRLYNEDFTKLSTQLSELKSLPFAQVTNSGSIENIGAPHFKLAQQASNGLFHDLDYGWSCDDKISHMASMSLQLGECFRNKTSKVSFSVALKCSHSSSIPPVRLVIESAPNNPNEEIQLDNPSTELQKSLKKMGAVGKSVRFSPVSAGPTAVSQSSSCHPLLDPQKYGKLCQYFQKLDTQNIGDSCVGFLEKTQPIKHFIYPKPLTRSSVGISQSASLKELLQAAMNEKREEDCMDKLKLAKLLSLAVLRFHSTPWLSDSWSSNDIRFFWDDTAPQQNSRLQNPCIDVQLSRGTSAGPNTLSGSNLPSFAPNEVLFNLAIVLIELGYDSPFESLHENPSDNHINPELLAVRKNLAARKLCGGLYRRPMLNMNYQRIVHRCLYCNFGVAMELDDAELQKKVYDHVVNELEKCLKAQSDANALYPPLSGV